MLTPIDQFKNAFNEKHYLVNGEELFYLFQTPHCASKSCSEANMLIDRMKIELTATHEANNPFFIVKEN